MTVYDEDVDRAVEEVEEASAEKAETEVLAAEERSWQRKRTYEMLSLLFAYVTSDSSNQDGDVRMGGGDC